MEKVDLLTWLNHISKVLPNSHQQNLRPRSITLVLWETESPGPAFDIARIFPDGLDTALEEVDGVLHLERVERKAVVALPKRFDGENVLLENGQAAFVRTLFAVLIVVKGPRVSQRWWAHELEHVEFGGIALGGSCAAQFGGWWSQNSCGRGAIFLNCGEPVDTERRTTYVVHVYRFFKNSSETLVIKCGEGRKWVGKVKLLAGDSKLRAFFDNSGPVNTGCCDIGFFVL